MAKDTGSSFDRDFGYLIPFLDRVSTAGAGLEASARAELQQLLAGEKEKWQRIRDLLAGAAPSATSAARPAGAAPHAEPSPAGGGPLPTALTVGSLRKR